MQLTNAGSPFRLLLSCLVSVLALTAPLHGRTLYLSPDGDDSAANAAGVKFRTLAVAAARLEPGDTLFIREGVYLGGVQISLRSSGQAPLVIRGESLSAVIDSCAGSDMPDGLRIQDCSWVRLENLTVLHALRAGCAVRFSDNVTLSGCRFGDNEVWGIFTSFSDDILFENNECYGSKEQHGIYHSNSGDRFVIRGNRIYDNAGCGFHMNGDPEMGGDGVLNWGLVENNIIYRNGQAGGGGINMTHVHDILVRNNLLYNNYSSGFTVYQDTGTHEQGSKRVVITGNTCVFQPGRGRNVVNIQPTSEYVIVTGNIMVCGRTGSFQAGTLQVDSDYPKTIVTDYNIHWAPDTAQLVTVKDRFQTFASWSRSTGNGKHSKIAAPGFVAPDKGDYSLAPGSSALEAGMPFDSLHALLDSLAGFEWILARLDSLPYQDIQAVWRPLDSPPDAGAYQVNLSGALRLDFNGDRGASLADAPALARMILAGGGPRCDINGDGRSSALDVLALILDLLKL